MTTPTSDPHNPNPPTTTSSSSPPPLVPPPLPKPDPTNPDPPTTTTSSSPPPLVPPPLPKPDSTTDGGGDDTPPRTRQKSRLEREVSLSVGLLIFYFIQPLVVIGFFLLYHYKMIGWWNAVIFCGFLLIFVNCYKFFNWLIEELSIEVYAMGLSYGLVLLLGINVLLFYQVCSNYHGHTTVSGPARTGTHIPLLIQVGAAIEGQKYFSAKDYQTGLETKLASLTPASKLVVHESLKAIFASTKVEESMNAPLETSVASLKKNKGRSVGNEAFIAAQVLDFLLRNFYSYTQKMLTGKLPSLLVKIKNLEQEEETVSIYAVNNMLVLAPSSKTKIKGYAPLVFKK